MLERPSVTIDHADIFTGSADPTIRRNSVLVPCFDQPEARRVTNWITNEYALEHQHPGAEAATRSVIAESAGEVWFITENVTHADQRTTRIAPNCAGLSESGVGWGWHEAIPATIDPSEGDS